MFEGIIGHEFQKEVLKRAVKEGAIAHAYLFSGPDGIGKKLVATQFAKLLNCQATDSYGQRPPASSLPQVDREQSQTTQDSAAQHSSQGCTCNSCSKIDKGIHPDVVFVEFEGIKNIKVEQIRETVESRLFLKPFEGKFKIVVVDESERMSIGAQNAFLKTLEEPPSYSVIILITSQPNSLLPTIRSRCQILRFNPLPKETVLQLLLKNTKTSPASSAIASKLSEGSLGQALRMDNENIELRKEIILKLIDLSPNSALHILDLVEALPLSSTPEDSENLKLAFKFISLWLRDLALLKIGFDDEMLTNTDVAKECRKTAMKWNVNNVLDKYKLVERTWYDIFRTNANKQLALENLFIKLGQH